jgi:hypothetical protein
MVPVRRDTKTTAKTVTLNSEIEVEGVPARKQVFKIKRAIEKRDVTTQTSQRRASEHETNGKE